MNKVSLCQSQLQELQELRCAKEIAASSDTNGFPKEVKDPSCVDAAPLFGEDLAGKK